MRFDASIVIAIVTYRRADSLARTLESLRELRLPLAVSVRVLVVDNDVEESAREVVVRLQHGFVWPLDYAVEPKCGIPHARNRVLALVKDSDWLAFIDDDDVADPGWLEELYATAQQAQADVVKGRIVYRFSPDCVRLSCLDIFSDSPSKTGDPVASVWTNNVLFSTAIYRKSGLRFDPIFTQTGGSDHYFFCEAKKAGAVMVMCREAVVFCDVPPERVRWRWLVRRHVRVGAMLTVSDRKSGIGTFKLLRRVLASTADSSVYAWRLLRGVVREQHPIIHPVMVGFFMLGRVLGIFCFSPREYARQNGRG